MPLVVCPRENATVLRLRSEGWRIFDVRAATLPLVYTPEVYTDTLHFGPAVNRGVNELLLLDLLDECPGRGLEDYDT